MRNQYTPNSPWRIQRSLFWRQPEKKRRRGREGKKMSQVIFASCTVSKGALFRPEWGQFPHPPSGASAAAFDQAPEGACPCPWRLLLLSKEAVLLCGSPVTPVPPITKQPAVLEPHPRKQPRSTHRRCPLPKAPAVPARLFGACPSTGRDRRGTRPPATGRLPFSRTEILEPDRLPATGAASGPTCVYPLGQEEFTPFTGPRNQKIHQEIGPFSCGFRLPNPIRNCNFTYGPAATIYPHLVHTLLKSSEKHFPRSFFGSVFTSLNCTDLAV